MLPQLLLALCLSSAQAAQKPEPTLQEQFDDGVKAMKRANYTKALEILNKIRTYHRDDPLSIEAELAIADVYYKKGDWDQARVAYQEFAKMHPRYRALDYVYYRMGSTLAKKAPKVAARDQTWTVQARDTWKDFRTLFPDSQYVGEVDEYLAAAEERLARKELLIAQFYARRKAWPAVQGRAVGLARTYAASSSLPEAMSLLDQALRAQSPENKAAVIQALDARATQLAASSEPAAQKGAAALQEQLKKLR